jgi:hypothetical protein
MTADPGGWCEPEDPPRGRLVAAVVAHLVMLPVWYVLGALMASSVAESSFPLAIALLALPCLIWLWMLTRLVRWWRQGHVRLWPYPLKWGLVLGFLWALVIPPVRRAMTPRRTIGALLLYACLGAAGPIAAQTVTRVIDGAHYDGDSRREP